MSENVPLMSFEETSQVYTVVVMMAVLTPTNRRAMYKYSTEKSKLLNLSN